MLRRLLLATPLLASGCLLYGSRPPMALPPTAAPLTALNSPFDDYNAAAPDVARGFLIYSTNRGTGGQNYDLWITELQFDDEGASVLLSPRPFAPMAMSPQDELGPFVFEDTLLFSSNRAGGAGGLDIYAVPLPPDWQRLASQSSTAPAVAAPALLSGLSSPGYDGYLAVDDDGSAIFASDRDGQGLDAYATSSEALSGGAATIARIPELSSPYDDTAFYLHTDGSERRVYFASNRPGQGDFDLYCAERGLDGTWSNPLPIQHANSPYKEFRPAIIRGYGRDVLIFSSNRPGGMGGMDLYYARVPERCAP